MNITDLETLNACRDAIAWVRAAGHAENLAAAWLACERGDWMLWFAAKRDIDIKIIVRAACGCARLALPYTKDARVLACIETAESWTRGESTIDQVRGACADAFEAATICRSAAEYNAAIAAYTAGAAALAKADDRSAASAISYAASAQKETRRKCADIVRKHIPELP